MIRVRYSHYALFYYDTFFISERRCSLICSTFLRLCWCILVFILFILCYFHSSFDQMHSPDLTLYIPDLRYSDYSFWWPVSVHWCMLFITFDTKSLHSLFVIYFHSLFIDILYIDLFHFLKYDEVQYSLTYWPLLTWPAVLSAMIQWCIVLYSCEVFGLPFITLLFCWLPFIDYLFYIIDIVFLLFVPAICICLMHCLHCIPVIHLIHPDAFVLLPLVFSVRYLYLLTFDTFRWWSSFYTLHSFCHFILFLHFYHFYYSAFCFAAISVPIDLCLVCSIVVHSVSICCVSLISFMRISFILICCTCGMGICNLLHLFYSVVVLHSVLFDTVLFYILFILVLIWAVAFCWPILCSLCLRVFICVHYDHFCLECGVLPWC